MGGVWNQAGERVKTPEGANGLIGMEEYGGVWMGVGEPATNEGQLRVLASKKEKKKMAGRGVSILAGKGSIFTPSKKLEK